MGFSMSHCARYLNLGPWVPDSFLPVKRLKTVTCSSPERLLIHSIGLPLPGEAAPGRAEAAPLPLGVLPEVAVAAEDGVVGLSGTTPIWSASHFCTLASVGPPPSISCSLLRSILPPSLTKAACCCFFSSLFLSSWTPLAAPRPNMISSRRFFFLVLSSPLPSGN